MTLLGYLAIRDTPRIRSFHVIAVNARANDLPPIVCASSKTNSSAPVPNADVMSLP